MNNNIDKYTLELKSRLDKNYISPLFIKYANLLYANEHYEECITVCRTGLEIYPEYLTAKLILLRGFMKAEYLNEAELLFNEIKSKLSNKVLRTRLENNIRNLKAISKQEKIYYSKSSKYKYDFRSFEKKFPLQENLFTEYTIEDLFSDGEVRRVIDEKEFLDFMSRLESFHFEKNIPQNLKHGIPIPAQSTDANELMSKIKIVTETLADIYAQQGNINEAFEAYNILLRAGSGNSRRIEEKINELERNMMKGD